MKNTITKTFTSTTSWTAPAGVTKVEIDGFYSGFNTLTRSNLAKMAINQDGDLYAWGDNRSGQLGDNSVVSKSTPVLVLGGHKFKHIGAGEGGSTMFGVDDQGNGWAWGSNRNSALGNGVAGNGSGPAASTPVLIIGGLRYLQIEGGADNGFGLTEDGDVYSWGQDYNGILGHGVSEFQQESSPVPVVGGHKFTQIDIGSYTAGALEKDTKQLYLWGGQSYNEYAFILGNANDGVTPASSPTLVSGGHRFVDFRVGFANAMGLTEDGELYAWGRNYFGECGQGDSQVPYSTPVLVSIPGKIKEIHINYEVFSEYDSMHAITEDGSWYAWGAVNWEGFAQDVIGNPPNNNESTPTLIATSLSISKFASGGGSGNSIITDDAEIYSWGNGFKGSMGNNTPSGSNSVPVEVVSTQMFRALRESFDNRRTFDVVPGTTYPIEFTNGYIKFDGIRFTNRNGKAILRYQA